MRNVDLYHSLVQRSHQSLLSLVVDQAEARDYAALKDFIHVMDQVGRDVRLFTRPKEITSTYHNAIVNDGDEELRSRFSFPRALIDAIAPSLLDEEGNKKTRGERLEETVTAEGIDFLSHAVKVGTTEISKAFADPKERENFLSFMLFQAVAKTSDPRVFNILIDAGANPAKKFVSQHDDEAGKTISAFKEALLFGNHQGATVLMDRLEPRKAVEAIAVMTEGPQDPGMSLPAVFYEMGEVTMLCHALNQGQHAQVGALLDKMCEKAEAWGTGGDSGQKIGGYFRCLLATSFLRSVTKRFDTDWTDEVIATIRGDAERLQPHSTIQGHALNWSSYTAKGGRTEERWAMMKEQADNIESTSYRYLMADLVQYAVRSHCLPILKDVESFVQPVSTQKYRSPDIGTAVFRATLDEPLIDPLRLRATIEFMVDHGHSINASHAQHARSGAPLHVLSRAAEPSVAIALPVLLKMGADSSALNGKGETACEAHDSDVAKKTWNNIQRSFDARNAAHGILSELENIGHEAPTNTKSPKP